MFEGFRFWSEKPRPKEEEAKKKAEIEAMKKEQYKIPEAKPSKVDPRASRGEHRASGNTPEEYRIGREGRTVPGSDVGATYAGEYIGPEDVIDENALPQDEAAIAKQEAGVEEEEVVNESAGLDDEMSREDYLDKYERDSMLMPSQRLTREEMIGADLQETEENIKEVKKIIAKLEREMQKTSSSSQPNLFRELGYQLRVQKEQLARLGKEKVLLEKEAEGAAEEGADVLPFAEHVQKVHEKQIERQTEEQKGKTEKEWKATTKTIRTDIHKTKRKGSKATIRKTG